MLGWSVVLLGLYYTTGRLPANGLGHLLSSVWCVDVPYSQWDLDFVVFWQNNSPQLTSRLYTTPNTALPPWQAQLADGDWPEVLVKRATL